MTGSRTDSGDEGDVARRALRDGGTNDAATTVVGKRRLAAAGRGACEPVAVEVKRRERERRTDLGALVGRAGRRVTVVGGRRLAEVAGLAGRFGGGLTAR
jgi:hypothetical protein